jgi:phasin family protein
MPFDNAEFAKFFAPARPFDWSGAIAVQQRNLDAVAQATKLVTEGFYATFRLQGETAAESLQQGAVIAAAAAGSTDVAATVKQQLAFAQSATAKGIAVQREIAELAGKNAKEAFELLRKRAQDSVGELTALLKAA